jgi:iron(III) transport system substrate-binding protein
MVRADEAPKTLQDLLDPKWKGQIGIVSPVINDYALSYFLALDHQLGPDKSQKFFEALAAQKPLFFGPNGVPVAQGVKNGQFAIAIAFLSHVYSVGGGMSGPLAVAPVPAYSTTGMGISVGVIANAPHPNAARLFVDYLLSSEGPKLLRQFGYVPTFRGAEPPEAFKATTILPAPPPADLDQLRQRLRDIFGL